MQQPSLVIDCFPESVERYRIGHAVIAVDVIRATTSVITAVSLGWHCYPVASLEAAWRTAARLQSPLLIGELAGKMPRGFHMNNSPAELAMRSDLWRPLVLLSSSGTKLICDAAGCEANYLACLRNYRAVANYIIGRHPQVAIIGAGSRGEFREEDQMCCAWIAEVLIEAGYRAANDCTREIVARWRGRPADAFTPSKSVDYLRRTGQLRDLDFVLAHVDDLPDVVALRGERALAIQRTELSSEPSLSIAAQND
jgi:2-phosphosulfolactate phosphatase